MRFAGACRLHHLHFLSGLLILALAAALATESPSQPSAAGKGGLAQLTWLAGCWQSISSRGTVEEHWLPPRGNSMVGVSRTVRSDTLLEYELVVLRERDGTIGFEAHPSGQPAAVFPARTITDSSATFENPAHDFPQRVGYTLRADSLIAWIEGERGGRLRRIEFPYVRVPCP
jgi:Domain of unknown function (DUF6265)